MSPGWSLLPTAIVHHVAHKPETPCKPLDCQPPLQKMLMRCMASLTLTGALRCGRYQTLPASPFQAGPKEMAVSWRHCWLATHETPSLRVQAMGYMHMKLWQQHG